VGSGPTPLKGDFNSLTQRLQAPSLGSTLFVMSDNDQSDKMTTALRQLFSASSDAIRTASEAAKGEPFSSHRRFVAVPAKAPAKS
jgi:hypothetical protein